MNKLKPEFVDKCRKLRIEGYSLGEISLTIGLARSTIYGYVNDISLSLEQKENIRNRNRIKNKNRVNVRKGKCLPGREIIKPKSWSNDLVHIVSHFMFDGRVDNDGCIYYSKDEYQINHLKKLIYKLFRCRPRIQSRDNGVYGLSIYNVEFADYINKRKHKLLSYLNNGASQLRKKIFLKAFFDDEGSVFFKADKRRVRGSQKSYLILENVRNLLFSFGIKGRINKEAVYIEISERNNLAKFFKKINFSPEIYINPFRKNGIWKRRISKREILTLLLKSYQV